MVSRHEQAVANFGRSGDAAMSSVPSTDGFEFKLVERTLRERRSGGAFSYFSARRNVLYVSRDHAEPDEQYAATFHELSHFLFHVATPYGLFLDATAQTEQRLFDRFFNALRQNEMPIPTPLGELINRLMTDQPETSSPREQFLANAIREILAPWSILAHLENIFEARKVESVARENAASAYRSLIKGEAILERELGEIFGTDAFSKLGSIIQSATAKQNEEFDACVLTNLYGSGTDRIGAAHIFEGLAKLAELDHGVIVHMREMPEYAYLYFAGFLLPALCEFSESGDPIQLPNGRAKFRADRSPERQKLFARAFVVICDLALFTPIGPIYGTLRDQFPLAARHWGQLHPGWRVLHAIRMAEDCAARMADLRTGIQFAHQLLSDKFGWIEPDYFFEVASKTAPKNNWMQRHLQAMSLRAENPERFFSYLLREDGSFESITDYIQKFAPWMHIPWRYNGFIIKGPDDLLDRLIVYFRACALEEIIWEPHFRELQTVPSDIQYQDYFSNLQSPAAVARLLRESLIGETEHR
jgi:hypothetical protein